MRRRRLSLLVWLIAIGLLAYATDSLREAEEIAGLARVVDGDTIEILDVRIRLYAIDAPELAQTCRLERQEMACGRAVAARLGDRLAGNPVRCRRQDRDRYGRMVAICRAGEDDLGAWLVAGGWARAEIDRSLRYAVDETAARLERRGLWAGDWEAPWEFRRRLGQD